MPSACGWSNWEDVEQYAIVCMERCGLSDWAFKADRAIRRLGCCRMARREISLSRYFVALYLERNQDLIRRTILHEIAHALAWLQAGERGHGAVWHQWCVALGIADEKASCKCEDFAPPERQLKKSRYALCHRITGEVYRYYQRRPRISMRKLRLCYIPGKKADTLGNLCIVELE